MLVQSCETCSLQVGTVRTIFIYDPGNLHLNVLQVSGEIAWQGSASHWGRVLQDQAGCHLQNPIGHLFRRPNAWCSPAGFRPDASSTCHCPDTWHHYYYQVWSTYIVQHHARFLCTSHQFSPVMGHVHSSTSSTPLGSIQSCCLHSTGNYSNTQAVDTLQPGTH